MQIYADNAATTKMSEAAIEAMTDCVRNWYGNPSSLYTIGQKAKEKLEEAEVIIAKGQGNFETLYFCGLNVYYLFMCKCDLFANRFQVPRFTGMLLNDRKMNW